MVSLCMFYRTFKLMEITLNQNQINCELLTKLYKFYIFFYRYCRLKILVTNIVSKKRSSNVIFPSRELLIRPYTCDSRKVQISYRSIRVGSLVIFTSTVNCQNGMTLVHMHIFNIKNCLIIPSRIKKQRLRPGFMTIIGNIIFGI